MANNVKGFTQLINTNRTDEELKELEEEVTAAGDSSAVNDEIKKLDEEIQSALRQIGAESDGETASVSSKSSKSSKSSRSSSRSSHSSHVSRSSHVSSHSALSYRGKYDTEDQYRGLSYHQVRERKQKALTKIKQLMGSLDSEGINYSSIGRIPDESADLKDIESVMHHLMMINDNSKCNSIFNEILLNGAQALEFVFDGNTAIPGTSWKPNYTGYSSTLNVKLSQLQYETSEVVGTFIEQNNLGAFTKLALTLLPSLVFYPKLNSTNKVDRLRSTRMELEKDERRELLNKL